MFKVFLKNNTNVSCPSVIAEAPSPVDFKNEPTFIEDAKEYPREFLNSLGHFNQKIVLDYLLNLVSDAKSLVELQKIYMDHVDEPYLNIKVMGIFKKSYSNIKKAFIENIQRSITEYFMNTEIFKSSENIIIYHTLCRDLLQNEVFSKDHEKYGINPIFRRNLSRNFEAFEKIFCKTISPVC